MSSSTPYSTKEGLVTCFFTEKKPKSNKDNKDVDSLAKLTFPAGSLSAAENSQISAGLQTSNISSKKFDKRVLYSVPGLPNQVAAVSAGEVDEKSVYYRNENIRTSVRK